MNTGFTDWLLQGGGGVRVPGLLAGSGGWRVEGGEWRVKSCSELWQLPMGWEKLLQLKLPVLELLESAAAVLLQLKSGDTL